MKQEDSTLHVSGQPNRHNMLKFVPHDTPITIRTSSLDLHALSLLLLCSCKVPDHPSHGQDASLLRKVYVADRSTGTAVPIQECIPPCRLLVLLLVPAKMEMLYWDTMDAEQASSHAIVLEEHILELRF